MRLSTGGRTKYRLCAALFLFTISVAAVWGAESMPASDPKKDNKNSADPSAAAIANELARLQDQLAAQQKLLAAQQSQIEELQQLLRSQRKDSAAGSEPASNTEVSGQASNSGGTAAVPVSKNEPAPAASAAPKTQEPAESPLSFRIGSAYITPVGFMDFTGIFRSTSVGSGIGTNFGSIPYSNTTQGNLTDMRFSAQNSRIGVRVDAGVKGAHVIGYWESDFLGFVPGNAAVSSNSDSFRLRLYWVDVSKGSWEVLGGQSWSMLTPGRKGISPLPADLFYSQNIDVNYQLGLTWSRDQQVRVVYHPSRTVAAGISLASPEQYIGGSGGGGLIVLPPALATPYSSQLNNGGTTLSVPGVHPDIIAKVAFDPEVGGHALHFEVAGLVRTFKVWNPTSNQDFSATGVGGQANLNFELFKGFRLVTNNYWSEGGGRYIFGQAPDLVVRADGSLSPVKAASTVSGFEYTNKNTMLYGYYGGVYIGRNVAIDTTGKYIGYGFPGSPNSQNRAIQEATFGIAQTFWKDARYVALLLMSQYSYLFRNPWVVASGQPAEAKSNMIFINLRYALPGSAPVWK